MFEFVDDPFFAPFFNGKLTANIEHRKACFVEVVVLNQVGDHHIGIFKTHLAGVVSFGLPDDNALGKHSIFPVGFLPLRVCERFALL